MHIIPAFILGQIWDKFGTKIDFLSHLIIPKFNIFT